MTPILSQKAHAYGWLAITLSLLILVSLREVHLAAYLLLFAAFLSISAGIEGKIQKDELRRIFGTMIDGWTMWHFVGSAVYFCFLAFLQDQFFTARQITIERNQVLVLSWGCFFLWEVADKFKRTSLPKGWEEWSGTQRVLYSWLLVSEGKLDLCDFYFSVLGSTLAFVFFS